MLIELCLNKYLDIYEKQQSALCSFNQKYVFPTNISENELPIGTGTTSEHVLLHTLNEPTIDVSFWLWISQI